MRVFFFLVLAGSVFFCNGCLSPQIRLFAGAEDPLIEFTLEGEAKGKVAVIPVKGVISDNPKDRLLGSQPGMVQEIVSQIKLAEKDKDVKAVVFKIDSPGGSITASDILYHEIMAFKKRAGVKIVAVMMDVAASGGYYVALPADFIVAHPTTVTGSIGAIFLHPSLTALMGKAGVAVEVNKSGENKDMASPFRQTTAEEHQILQSLIDEMGRRFLGLVETHRRLDQQTLRNVSTARIYTAAEALKLELVDEIGYLSEAVSKAKALAGLPEDARVVVYRRTEYPDDNLYNNAVTQSGAGGFALLSWGLPESLNFTRTGFYYLWLPAVMPN